MRSPHRLETPANALLTPRVEKVSGRLLVAVVVKMLVAAAAGVAVTAAVVVVVQPSPATPLSPSPSSAGCGRVQKDDGGGSGGAGPAVVCSLPKDGRKEEKGSSVSLGISDSV